VIFKAHLLMTILGLRLNEYYGYKLLIPTIKNNKISITIHQIARYNKHDNCFQYIYKEYSIDGNHMTVVETVPEYD
jgi:hypothetical protein